MAIAFALKSFVIHAARLNKDLLMSSTPPLLTQQCSHKSMVAAKLVMPFFWAGGNGDCPESGRTGHR